MPDLEFLQSVKVILGALLGGATSALTALWWFWARIVSHVNGAVDPLEKRSTRMGERSDALERRMSSLEGRMSTIESRLDSLASRDDLNAVMILAARVEERTSATDQKVDTLYRAVIEVRQG